MSSISCCRSVPAAWMTCANSTCFAVRFCAEFCASTPARMSMLVSGVRSSWDMLARNSDLYRDASASCWARSSISCRACSISKFLTSMSRFCRTSSAAFSSSSALDCCSSSGCSSPTGLQLGGQPLRLVEQGVGAGVGDDRVEVDADALHQLLEEVALHGGEPVERRQLDDAEHLVLEHDRQHDQVDRRRGAQARGDPHVARAGSPRRAAAAWSAPPARSATGRARTPGARRRSAS